MSGVRVSHLKATTYFKSFNMLLLVAVHLFLNMTITVEPLITDTLINEHLQ
jgi:hypothetical protein